MSKRDQATVRRPKPAAPVRPGVLRTLVTRLSTFLPWRVKAGEGMPHLALVSGVTDANNFAVSRGKEAGGRKS